MLKRWFAFMLVFALCLSFAACGTGDTQDSAEGCKHSWKKATCTSPSECRKCGETKGKALGHNYVGNTCEGIQCADCGRVKAPAEGHKFTSGVCSVCGGTAVSSTPTTPGTTATTPTTPDVGPSKPTGNPAFSGKTLEIYGMGTNESYNHDDWDGIGNYLWMQRAAVVEWADLNNVNVKFMGSYSQTQIQAAMTSREKPDLLFHTNMFPGIANAGLPAAFTQAEYDKLAAICDNTWLDMMTYGTQKVGLVLPWTGTMMCYYNKTMFDEYEVKTPKEYFDEGQWTWENFEKCMIEMTKDKDSDGEIDTYGLPGDSWGNLVNPWAYNDKGELISTIDEPWMRDFFQMKYDAFTVKEITVAHKNNIQKNVIYPMFAMQLSDCETYRFEHLYQTIANGNELEVVPVPEWVGENGQKLNNTKVTQACVSLAVSCDERELAVDCLSYLLKCGLKYISDTSFGAIPCEYDGIQGYCEYSNTWKELFTEACSDRRGDYEDLLERNPDAAEHIVNIHNYLSKRDKYIYGTYSGVTALTSYSEIAKMPPNSSIPAIREKYQAQLNTYNDIYIRN